ncbi:ATP-binding protein, partial [bacterium]|nr:ATP-binding protein [bacterium]
MLIEMSVGNFLSFKEPVKISMIAANSVKEHKNSNIIETENYKLLKSSVLYGANASGKSNLIKAMTFMKWFVISSSKDTQTHERIPVTPYKLSRETSGKPSFFEIVILKNKIKYRYGFELDSHGVKSEWLLFSKKKKEYELFLRDEQDFEIFPKFKEGEKLESKTRGNALFLSVVAQFNGEISEEILEWFNDLQIITGLDYKPYKDVSESMLRSDKYRKNLIELLKIADTGIESCSIEEKEKISIPVKNGVFKTGNDIFTMNLSYEKSNVDTLHKIIDDEENRAPEFIEFDLENDESEGTKKFLYIIGPILKAIIENTVL